MNHRLSQSRGKKARIVAPCLIISFLSACGGGGGSPAFPSGPSGGVSTPTSISTLNATGSVLDLGAQRYAGDGGTPGAAIDGATVVVGPTLINGATPPPSLPSGDALATTSASGVFTVSGFSGTGTTYVEVFPASGDSHVSLHALANISAGSIRKLFLYAPNATEIAELAQINSDRTTNGANPVIFDEIAIETARASADFKATNGYYQHCVPASLCVVTTSYPTTAPASFAAQYVSPDDLYSYLQGAVRQVAASNATENFVPGPPGITWAQADATFMAEKTSSPQGLHYLNIVNGSHTWTGIGSNTNGVPVLVNGASTGYPTFTVYTQEFYSSTGGV